MNDVSTTTTTLLNTMDIVTTLKNMVAAKTVTTSTQT